MMIRHFWRSIGGQTMSSSSASGAVISGKRSRSKVGIGCEEEGNASKRHKPDCCRVNDMNAVNKSRIYNFGYRKKPAELFRKDLISAMKMADTEQLNREEYLPITDSWREEWEKGVQVAVNPDILPEPQVKILRECVTTDNPFKLPKKLIKSRPESEPIASNYELDLKDLCWLEAMTECDICGTRSPDAEEGNEMVFCDLCNICVHQACYGIVDIPEGDWLCRPCKEFGSQKNISCVLCPNFGGALKPTSSSKQWAHVSCALWVPEVSIGCVSTMEPITKIKQIPQTRWNLICSLCNVKQGAPIQCSVKTCKIAYHVICAFNHKLKMKAIVESDKTKGVKLKSYCKKHTEKGDVDDDGNVLKAEAKGESTDNQSFLPKTQHEIEIATNIPEDEDKHESDFWKYIDINKVQQELIRTDASYSVSKMQYWKLKRTSNYGASLIPLTSSAQFQEQQQQQRNEILRMRVDLERIRNLSFNDTESMRVKNRRYRVCSCLMIIQDLLNPNPYAKTYVSQYKRKPDHPSQEGGQPVNEMPRTVSTNASTNPLNGLINKNKSDKPLNGLSSPKHQMKYNSVPVNGLHNNTDSPFKMPSPDKKSTINYRQSPRSLLKPKHMSPSNIINSPKEDKPFASLVPVLTRTSFTGYKIPKKKPEQKFTFEIDETIEKLKRRLDTHLLRTRAQHGVDEEALMASARNDIDMRRHQSSGFKHSPIH
ncbi:unnamed protein product [Medioppia subpectinata]|uniref:Protein Jade-1 n=1 Tax=Medioppia subpectinata TaxID=1979941 RepID=A0A7R9Q1A6_9ACAR|nr:unnamed protein product [Medioppia subpectinata]CAG2108997.1 unnamed protein product [Medioppia subpectinata]